MKGHQAKAVLGIILASLMVVSSIVVLVNYQPGPQAQIVSPDVSSQPYFNDTAGWNFYNVTLPDYNPLVSELGNSAGDSPVYGQLPIYINWRGHNGIYYINDANQLVDYNLTTDTVQVVNTIIPLSISYTTYYQAYNTEFYAPQGYNVVYMYGQNTVDTAYDSIEQVNLSTGAITMVNFSVTFNNENAQFWYLGHSIYMLWQGSNPPSSVYTYIINLTYDASQAQPLAHFYTSEVTGMNLPSGIDFEQNNAYWVPSFSSFLDVQDNTASVGNSYWLFHFNLSYLYSLSTSSYGTATASNDSSYLVSYETYDSNLGDINYADGITVDYANSTAYFSGFDGNNNAYWGGIFGVNLSSGALAYNYTVTSGSNSVYSITSSSIYFPLLNNQYGLTYEYGSNYLYLYGGASPNSLLYSFNLQTKVFTPMFNLEAYNGALRMPNGMMGNVFGNYRNFQQIYTSPNQTLNGNDGGVAGAGVDTIATPYSGFSTFNETPNVWPFNPYSSEPTQISKVNQANFSTPTALYNVSIQESGLPSGTAWAFDFNGVQFNISNSTYDFSEENGTYGLSVSSVPGGYTASAPSSVTVNGAAQTVNITFTPTAPQTYSVTVSESGLPSGTSWIFVFNGTSYTQTNTSYDFFEPNGTYSLSVSSISGYNVNYPSSITVSGSGQTASVVFSQATGGGTGPSTYSVSVAESGLPSGTTWYIYINGTRYSTDTTTMPAIYLPNGTYNYTISSSNPDYKPSPASGNVTIQGQPFQIGTVSFSYDGPAGQSPGNGNNPGGGNNGTSSSGGGPGVYQYLEIGALAASAVIVAIILFFRKKGGPPIESGKEL